MSSLPRRIPFQETSIDSIKNMEDMKRVFKEYVKQINKIYDKIYDNAENGGCETNSWRIKEAAASDVVSGLATAVGDLLFQRKVNGVWLKADSIRGS